MQDKLKIKVKKATAIFLCLGLFFQQTAFAQVAGSELSLSGYFNRPQNYVVADKFRPSHLRYFSYDAFRDQFQVLLDKGDARQIEGEALKENTRQLLDYFLIGVALPNDVFWVNLRPDTPDQIIDPVLAQTDIGKIFLEADLQLKKDTARFTSPQTPEGRAYWDKLYKKAGELFGSENVTIPTLTRPWIVPGEIIIRETQDSAYIYKASLKVMLESDYLKSSNNPLSSSDYTFKDPRLKALNEYSAEIIREQIIPKLTKDINISQRYAPLRQVFYSLILSRWFKSRFTGKSGTYASLINTGDLSGLTSKEQWSKTFYFKEYRKSFKDGEYNIQEPIYSPYGQTMRSYFSGGANFSTIDFARTGSSPIELGAFDGRRPDFAKRLVLAGSLAMVSLTGIPGTRLLAVQPPQPALVAQAATQIAAEVPFRDIDITNEPGRNLTRFGFSGVETKGGNDAFCINIKGTTAQGQPFDAHIRTDWPFVAMLNNGIRVSRNPQDNPKILPAGQYTINMAHVTYKDGTQQILLQSNPLKYSVTARPLLPGEIELTTGSYDLLPAPGGIKGGGVNIGGAARPEAVSPFLEKTQTDKKGLGASSPAQVSSAAAQQNFIVPKGWDRFTLRAGEGAGFEITVLLPKGQNPAALSDKPLRNVEGPSDWGVPAGWKVPADLWNRFNRDASEANIPAQRIQQSLSILSKKPTGELGHWSKLELLDGAVTALLQSLDFMPDEEKIKLQEAINPSIQGYENSFKGPGNYGRLPLLYAEALRARLYARSDKEELTARELLETLGRQFLVSLEGSNGRFNPRIIYRDTVRIGIHKIEVIPSSEIPQPMAINRNGTIITINPGLLETNLVKIPEDQQKSTAKTMLVGALAEALALQEGLNEASAKIAATIARQNYPSTSSPASSFAAQQPTRAASPVETLTGEERAEHRQYVEMGVIYMVPGVKTSVIANWSPDLDRNKKGLNMLQLNSEKEELAAARRIAKPYLLTPEEEADYQVLKDMGLIRRSMNLGIDGKLYFAALLNWNPYFQPDSTPDIRNYTSRKDALSEIRGLLSHFRLEEIRTHVLERPGLLNAYLRALEKVQGQAESFKAEEIIRIKNNVLNKAPGTNVDQITRGIGTPAQGLRGVVRDLLNINENVLTIQAGMSRSSIVPGGIRTINGMINAEGIIVELKEVLDTAETSRRQLYGFRLKENEARKVTYQFDDVFGGQAPQKARSMLEGTIRELNNKRTSFPLAPELSGPSLSAASPVDTVENFKSAGLYDQLLDSGRFQHESIQRVDRINLDAAIRAIDALGVNLTPEAISRVLGLINTETNLNKFAAVTGLEGIRGIAIAKLKEKQEGRLPATYLDEHGLPAAFRTWVMVGDVGEMIDLSRATSEADFLKLTSGPSAASPLNLDAAQNRLRDNPLRGQPLSPITPGGIDFRTMEMMIQPMGRFNGLNFTLPALSQVQNINVDEELLQVRTMVDKKIMPSGERIKELLAAIFAKNELERRADDFLVCLVDICRLQEELVDETSPELREALVIFDTQKFVVQ
jgi:hypothetical protein